MNFPITLRRARHALKWLLVPVSARIRGGPLAGMRWSALSGRHFVRGDYEASYTEAFESAIGVGDVVYDIGAHVGYYSAIASRLVGASGQVVAFEPRPLNLRFLRWHIRANALSNVRVIEAAVGERAGSAMFDTRRGTGTGRVSDSGDLRVEMVCLDELVATGTLPSPDFLKIDVEGGEVSLLRGARTVIENCRPRLMLSIHGRECYDECRELLTSAGYELRAMGQRRPEGDADLLAIPAPSAYRR